MFWTVANPSIDMGGFFGERKSDIYALLPDESYPTTVLINPELEQQDQLAIVSGSGIGFPLIVKPNVGERGEGVVIVKSESQLIGIFADAKQDSIELLVQNLVTWPEEFGLMCYKDPVTKKATLLSITGKQFLKVKGNGIDTVGTLLKQHFRGQKQVERLAKDQPGLLEIVPPDGQEVLVEPIGNHCRGTLFFDSSSLITPKLQAAVQLLMEQIDGVYFGRFDVRSPSQEALKDGIFTVIELNGVTSEPAHIYDPNYTIWKCWSELYRHHSLLPHLSEQLIKQGYKPSTLFEILERSELHFGINVAFWKKALLFLGAKKSF